MQLNRLPIPLLREGLLSRKFSCEEVVRECLTEIEAHNARLNIVLQMDRDSLLQQAREQDSQLAQTGSLPPLAGVVVGIKDNLHVDGFFSTCASRMLEGFEPVYEATAVKALRDAGALLLGKLNCDEFAMGSANENSAFGPVLNPLHEGRVPGGSSGGSAAAVAAGFCHATLGSDTGGSIRQPAAFCSVSGFKPTYGSVSRRGLVAFASSFDQIGPLAQDIRDVWSLFSVIRGKDPKDASSLVLNAEQDAPVHGSLKGLRIGYAPEFFGSGVQPGIAAHLKQRLQGMQSAGAELVEISFSMLSHALPVYYILSSAEASSNLARYDTVRYGHRVASGSTIEEMFFENRSLGFGEEVKRRILLGTYVLSEGYYDAYYLKAQKIRTLIRADFAKAFEVCDVIAAPTSPVPPFALGQHVEDAMAMYMADVLTVPASLAGIPALSLPAGSDCEGLPVGLQLMGPALQDKTLIEAAYAMQEWMKEEDQ